MSTKSPTSSRTLCFLGGFPGHGMVNSSACKKCVFFCENVGMFDGKCSLNMCFPKTNMHVLSFRSHQEFVLGVNMVQPLKWPTGHLSKQLEQEFQLHWQGGKRFVLTNAIMLQEKTKFLKFSGQNTQGTGCWMPNSQAGAAKALSAP